ncbi:hypothetical protein E0H26_28535 [Micromonospora zingiberis]|uniref:Uncharacterized protein n=1 Tax=Micromonospora zingiberis TaxID=2053011 RepID=A0A4V2LUC9_9ACTN|nr:hypothetical protein [Micromonospora zingiberis]TCB88285.1 hypothetical protein E0H26_28535 [Micromonospora zingiberis]
MEADTDAAGQRESQPAGSVVQGWTYGRAGRLIFSGESGLPEPPLSRALRSTACDSLLGVIVGLVICLVAVGFGWAEHAGVAGLAATGTPRVRRGYRLRMAFFFVVAAVACLVIGIVVTGGLRAPWDVFLPLVVALSLGSLAGTTAAYLPVRTRQQRR